MSASATDPTLASPPASGSARRLTPKKLYRILAIAEAITWTLLISGLIIRAATDIAVGVTIGGSVHGFVFLAYGATAILTAINQRWSVGLGAFAVVTAVIPYATIPFERWVQRTGKLEGDWRREATDDPRDQRWFDRLVRWMLNHPYLLASLVLLAVVALYAVLLILGPPVPKA
jgi:integral membrane protein